MRTQLMLAARMLCGILLHPLRSLCFRSKRGDYSRLRLNAIDNNRRRHYDACDNWAHAAMAYAAYSENRRMISVEEKLTTYSEGIPV